MVAADCCFDEDDAAIRNLVVRRTCIETSRNEARCPVRTMRVISVYIYVVCFCVS